MKKQRLIKAIVTGFYVGLSPVISGTFGSLLAFPLSLGLLYIAEALKIRLIIPGLDIVQQEILALFTIFICVCAIIFIGGKYLVDIYILDKENKDPKEVVIDEIAGQMLTLILSVFCPFFAHHSWLSEKFTSGQIDFIFLFLLPFTLFRIFDGLKPWPISWIDTNIKGGTGVMLDDFVAAIFASVMSYAITFVIIGNYSVN